MFLGDGGRRGFLITRGNEFGRNGHRSPYGLRWGLRGHRCRGRGFLKSWTNRRRQCGVLGIHRTEEFRRQIQFLGDILPLGLERPHGHDLVHEIRDGSGSGQRYRLDLRLDRFGLRPESHAFDIAAATAISWAFLGDEGCVLPIVPVCLYLCSISEMLLLIADWDLPDLRGIGNLLGKRGELRTLLSELVLFGPLRMDLGRFLAAIGSLSSLDRTAKDAADEP